MNAIIENIAKDVVHATLKEASWHPFYSGSLVGKIEGDMLCRFKDGQVVTTTKATKIAENIYQTRSGTIYRVEFAAKDDLPERVVRQIAHAVSLTLTQITIGDEPSVLVVRDGSKTRTFKLRLEEVV